MSSLYRAGNLAVVGIGPGGQADLTGRAEEALRRADRIVGYQAYAAMIRAWLPDSVFVESSIGAETERCRTALDLANRGHRVALICSGDAGIYAMAGLVYELAWQQGWRFDDAAWPAITVVPGVTAATAAAALVGAPLMSDFATISLSDLLTPWSVIERRLRGAALGDFVVALYNPMSERRRRQLPLACAVLLEQRVATTPVAIVRQVGRPEQEVRMTTLGQLATKIVDMLSVIIVGNSTTRVLDGRLVTPRGYPLFKAEEDGP